MKRKRRTRHLTPEKLENVRSYIRGRSKRIKSSHDVGFVRTYADYFLFLFYAFGASFIMNERGFST